MREGIVLSLKYRSTEPESGTSVGTKATSVAKAPLEGSPLSSGFDHHDVKNDGHNKPGPSA
jgi:hypothetical protein